MPLHEQELLEVVEGVWLPTLELTVQPAEHLDESDDLYGCEIRLHGAFDGIVYLISSRAMLDTAAATMFQQSIAESTEADARDALAELTNMVAGIIKSVLPEPTDLTLPMARNSGEWPGPEDADAFGTFTCHGEPISLILCECSIA